MREPVMANPLHVPLQFSQQFETIMAESTARFGFVAFAETWNGRLAMLGFVIGLGAVVDGYAACRTQFLPFCF